MKAQALVIPVCVALVAVAAWLAHQGNLPFLSEPEAQRDAAQTGATVRDLARSGSKPESGTVETWHGRPPFGGSDAVYLFRQPIRGALSPIRDHYLPIQSFNTA